MTKAAATALRKRWLDWMRANPNLQLHGGSYGTVRIHTATGIETRSGRHICAMEVARQLAKLTEDADSDYEESGRRVGLTPEQVRTVTGMNDGQHGERLHSFQEIADAVEQWSVAVEGKDK